MYKDSIHYFYDKFVCFYRNMWGQNQRVINVTAEVVLAENIGLRQDTADLQKANDNEIRSTPLDNTAITKKALKKLIKNGEKKGCLSFAEINDAISYDLKLLDQIENIIIQFKELGIKIVDKENTLSASKSYNNLLESANHGDIEAQYILGMVHEDGKDITQNFTKSLYWYERAAEGGHPDAQYHLGRIYFIGNEVTEDCHKAIYWYKKAAEQGNHDAQFCLGEMYEYGEEVTQDLPQAIRWYKEAAKKGNLDSQRNLGILYEIGKGVQQNYRMAAYWYKRAVDSILLR